MKHSQSIAGGFSHKSIIAPAAFSLLGSTPRLAVDVWTKQELVNLYSHLHNGNDSTRFVMGFLDEKSGCKKYTRSRTLLVDRAITWSISSAGGKAKSPLAFVPYSTNSNQESRWGGMDFDAHQPGQADRARELAFSAFRLLLNEPQLAVILETSGSAGWHVWAISQDFHKVQDWVQLLKSVASKIGTVISSGVCEIFPPDSLPSVYGKPMRAPGSWNPGTGKFNEIVWENTRTSLASVLSGKSYEIPLETPYFPHDFPDKEKSISFSPPLYHLDQILTKLGITRIASRNDCLSSLVGHIFHQVGIEMARRIASAQYRSAAVVVKASEVEHMDSFEKLWAGLYTGWLLSLSELERNVYNNLSTDNERDAFRIVRSWNQKAISDNCPDFPVSRDNLAERIGITGKGAAGIRDKFAAFGIIEKTADYIPNKKSARYRWALRG